MEVSLHTCTVAEASLSSQLHEILDQNASKLHQYGVSDLEQKAKPFDYIHKGPKAISCRTAEANLMIHKESFSISHLSCYLYTHLEEIYGWHRTRMFWQWKNKSIHS